VIVYIAAPYTSDPDGNIDKVLDVAEKIFALGHGVIVPHLNHLWHQRRPKSYEYWMKQDMILLSLSTDVFFGMWDDSPGRDRESALALRLGKGILMELPPPAPIPEWTGLWTPPGPAVAL